VEGALFGRCGAKHGGGYLGVAPSWGKMRTH